jgi:hypothetical protein
MSSRSTPQQPAAEAAAEAAPAAAASKKRPASPDPEDGAGDKEEALPSPAAGGRPPRAAKKQRNANEDTLADAAANATSADLQEEITLREAYEAVPHAHTRAWLADWDDKTRRKADRSGLNESTPIGDVLTFLVRNRAKFKPPADEVFASELETNFRGRGGQAPPASGAAAASKAVRAAADGAELERKRAEAMAFLAAHPEAPATPAAAAKAGGRFPQPVFDVDDDDEDDPDPPAAPPVSGNPIVDQYRRQSAVPIPFEGSCLSCATVRKPGRREYVCENCGLRGDLYIDAPVNKHLAAMALIKASMPAAAASSSSSSVSSSGQAKPDTHDTPASSLSKLEREFVSLAREAPAAYPIFNAVIGTPAEAEAAVAAAFLLGRQSLGAPQQVQPSVHLVRLIQSGKLKHVGWAIPKLVGVSARDADVTVGFLLDSRGGMTAQSRDLLSPPVVQSLGQFFEALLAVILPSLAAQPAAQQEWMALARTMIHLDATYGWVAAVQYCDQLLNERVPQAMGFALPSQQILIGLHTFAAGGSRPRNGGGATVPNASVKSKKPPGGSGGSGGGGGDKRAIFCFNFNNGKCERPEADCKYKHACSGCGAPGQRAGHGGCKRSARPHFESGAAAAAAAPDKGRDGK